MAAITDYVLTPHAEFEMQRRGIGEETVREVMTSPEQAIDLRPGRAVLQSRMIWKGRPHLVRVIVDVGRRPAEVVTAYSTNKISKYWRGEE